MRPVVLELTPASPGPSGLIRHPPEVRLPGSGRDVRILARISPRPWSNGRVALAGPSHIYRVAYLCPGVTR